MQEIRSSNLPVVTEICDSNKSRVWQHYSLKLGSKLKYLKKESFSLFKKPLFPVKLRIAKNKKPVIFVLQNGGPKNKKL